MSFALFDPPDFLGLDSDEDLLSAGLLAGAGFDSLPELVELGFDPPSLDPDASFAGDALSFDGGAVSPDELSLADELSPEAAPAPSACGAVPRCAFLP